MTPELYKALQALCFMWDQYCGDEWGHMCMTAGEHAEDVLDNYSLLIHGEGYAAEVNDEALEKLYKIAYNR